MRPVQRLLERLPDAKRCGEGWLARCPAHDDQHPSLSIDEGADGRALIHCHAGCTPEKIVAAAGLTLADLMPALPTAVSKQNGKPRIVATYDYRDEAGQTVFQVVRYEPKDFRQRQSDGNGGWNWSVKGARVVPYRLPELLASPAAPVYVVEGEKDADNLAKIGVLATCNAGGAGKWTREHSQYLRGRQVFVLPDNDEVGHNHAQQVAQSLLGIAESVRVVELPGLPPKGDVSDWLAAGGTAAELKRLSEASTTPALRPWPEIAPFDDKALPEFPTHALADWVRGWVEAESHATQTPPDLAGMLALAVCAAAIARRVVVEPRPRWREPTNLFVAVLLKPANLKSVVFADATAPLRELQAEMRKASRASVARAQSERRQLELQLRRLEKLAAKKGDPETRYEACKLAEELAALPVPVLPRLIVDDVTVEKLGMMLAEQSGRIASMSPEGGVFDIMAGMYSKNGMPQFTVYLMGHSGDDLFIDRASRESILVERPALTCAYAIQPAVIKRLAANPVFRDRGLLAKFLYAAPQSWIGRREIDPAPVPDDVWNAYRWAVRALAEIEGETTLYLTDEARGVFHVWREEIEVMMCEGGVLESIDDWGGRLAGTTLRLAGVLHCIDKGATGEIQRQTMEAAIEIARYLIPHAEAVLTRMHVSEKTAEDDAQYVLRWIKRHGKREFTKSEAQHHGKRRFPRAEDIDAALAVLVKRGYVRPKPAGGAGPGRPASPAYEVNPEIQGKENQEARANDAQEGNFGNIGSAL